MSDVTMLEPFDIDGPGGLRAEDLPDLGDAALVMGAARRQRTVTAYASDWEKYRRWAVAQRGHGRAWHVVPSPVPVVLAYLEHVRASGGALASARRYLHSIKAAHNAAGHPSPTSHPDVAEYMRGWRQEYARPTRRVLPLSVEHLRYCAIHLPPTERGVRDRCMLLIGFAAGMRCDELSRLCWEDVTVTPWGVALTIQRSKTSSHPRTVAVAAGMHPTCPVSALETWRGRISPEGEASGPLFREVTAGDRISARAASTKTIHRAVRRAAQLCGLKEVRYGGHSLRAGFVTTCAEHGIPDAIVQATTGHRSRDQLADYTRLHPTKRSAALAGIL